MICRECIDFLHDYLAASLPAAQRSEFERHLAECPPCHHYLQTYEQTIRLGKAACTGAQESADLPEELVRAILAARARRP